MKFFGRQNEIKEFQYRIPGVVDGGYVKQAHTEAGEGIWGATARQNRQSHPAHPCRTVC